MVSKIYSGVAIGIQGMVICVEADISPGLPTMNLVGYLSSSVKEAGDRVRTALRNTGFSIPPRRITISLSPADLRKDGSFFDLPIALAILLSMQVIPVELDISKYLIIGELGLGGQVLPVSGLLPVVDFAREEGYQGVIIPAENVAEACLVSGIEVIGVSSLAELLTLIDGERKPVDLMGGRRLTKLQSPFAMDKVKVDLADIHGQLALKQSVIIAAAGFHNIYMTGAAGSGKSMIAKCIPGILPALSYEEKICLTKIYSVAGLFKSQNGMVEERPFRHPHSSVTETALLGGGGIPLPGEISLADHGVLFLDEFPEFKRKVIESLRQPMEDGRVTIARVRASYDFPARFMLVAASNLCPCGYFPDRSRCHCSDREVYEYQNRISHPIMDRIDIKIHVKPVSISELFLPNDGITSQQAREIVVMARHRQAYRYRNESFKLNAHMPQGKINQYIPLTSMQKDFLKEKIESKDISARAYFRSLRLARSVADVRDHEEVRDEDLEFALKLKN